MAYAFVILALAFCIGTATSDIVNKTAPTVPEICALLPRGVTILRPHSCNKWVKCPSNAEATDFEEGSCVLGLYFNKDKGRCQYKDDVECPYSSKDRNRCATRDDGAFLTDGNSCNGYIFCKDGREMHSTCPNDLVFDPKKAACVYKQEYKCPLVNQNQTESVICRSIGNKLFFAHEQLCTKYHECINGALATHECAKDTAFDHILGRCVQRDNAVCIPTAKEPEPELTVCGTKENARVGYFADEKSCSGYYICEKQENGGPDRYPKHVTCDPGYFFDAEKWSCRERVNVKCALDRCEGMGNKYVNIAGDCRSYARCNNGIAVNKGTCPDNYFFDERTQGCTPQNINYIACSA